ncbi:hypothetical protein VKT23_013819 [Stygiomarasmius scandens]|uniref:BZIP domain-containing protein n=1 Tax=Marasmiellus scandens TaxID=2682957 RepID=A0ABR1J1V3_9AGAR
MVRGRKRDATAPLTRSLILQRDYRARKAQYIADLEAKVRRYEEQNEKLMKEVEDLRTQLYRREVQRGDRLAFTPSNGDVGKVSTVSNFSTRGPKHGKIKAHALSDVLGHLSLASSSIQHFQQVTLRSQYSGLPESSRSISTSPEGSSHPLPIQNSSSVASSFASSSRSSISDSGSHLAGPENPRFDLTSSLPLHSTQQTASSPLSSEISRSPSRHSSVPESYSPDASQYWDHNASTHTDENTQVFHAVGMMENRPSSLSMVRPPAYQSSLDASNCRRMPGQSNLRTTAHQFSSFDMGNQLPPINQPTVPMHHDMRQEPYDRAMMHSSADIRTTWV